ncbi:ATP-binding protein [Nocardiopsis terrae]
MSSWDIPRPRCGQHENRRVAGGVPVRERDRWRGEATGYFDGRPEQVARVREWCRKATGFDPDLVATVRLCAAELAANAVKYAPGGGFHRALAIAAPATLWLAIIDEGTGAVLPHIPTDRTDQEWDDAEGQRGLRLVEALATTWSHYPVGPGGAALGVGVWASFTLYPEQVPDGLGRLAMTR